MKNLKPTLFSFLLLISVAFFSSCNEYKSFSNATKVSQLSGNPFMYNLSKGMLGQLKTIALISGTKADVKKINLLTPLSQVLKTQEQLSTFKNVLNTAYKVPVKKMDAAWASIGTIKDLVMFVAKNGRNFQNIPRK